MRDFLDGILFFLGQAYLSNEEFETVVATETEYDQASYDDLARILLARESVSDIQDRLVHYYQAKGFNPSVAESGSSQIFLGAALC